MDNCWHSVLLTNSGAVPTAYLFSVVTPAGTTLGAGEKITIECDPGAESFVFAGRAAVFMFPGEQVACGWNARKVAVGTTVFTDYVILAPQAVDQAQALVNAILTTTSIPKPGLFFDFEKLFIEGIPLAAGLTMDVAVECGSIEGSAEAGLFFPCNFFNTLTITGGPIFNSITVTWGFEKILGPSTFSDVEVVAAGGPLLLIIDFSPLTFTPTFVFAQANFTINPDTNPASLRLRAIGIPGIVFADARLTITRAGLTFSADLDLDVDPVTQTFDFDDLTFGLNAQAGIVTVAANVVVKDHGRLGVAPEESFLLAGDLSFTVQF